MKVLVTGGTGVIGEGVIPALLREGHEVRLLTRGAERDAREWPRGVEPFAADVSDTQTLEGAAEECGAVVHITGIVSESPPEVTFERVNVGGTRNLLKEARRAGVRRFVFISSLGAERGASGYHRSKRKAEELVRKFRGDWLILRPGAVYGPGDEVISTLLKLVRALPAIPAVGDAEQRFQPVWYADFGAAVARAVSDESLARGTFEVAGEELTTTRDIVERLGRITGRSQALVPVPELVASLGVRVADSTGLARFVSDALGLDVSVDEAKVTMLVEENFIREAGANALREVFGVIPLALDEGLALLADSIPEQLPSDGFGPLRRKRFWADIEGGRYDAAELLKLFRERCAEIMPVEFDAEPGTPNRVERDATLTAALPLRGNIQMRVAEADKRRVTFVTIEGHPLAGVVSFSSEQSGAGVRFMVEIHARAANALDYLSMSTVGSILQDSNWIEVVERVVEESGGRAREGVEHDETTLEGKEAERVERRVEALVVGRRRAKNIDAANQAPRARKTASKQATAKKAAKGKATKSAKKRMTKTATKSGAEGAAKAGRAGASVRRGNPSAVADAVGAVASAALSAVNILSEVASAGASKRATKKGARKRR